MPSFRFLPCRRSIRGVLASGAGVLGIVASLTYFAGGNATNPAVPVPSVSRADIFLKPDVEFIRGLVPRNTTLDGLLRSHGLSGDTVARAIESARQVFDPRRLRASQPFQIERSIEGALRYFQYEIDAEYFLRVTAVAAADRPSSATAAAERASSAAERAAGSDIELKAELIPIPRTRQDAWAAGVIGGATPSLFQAMDAAGESPELTLELAEIFAGEIDFNNELQPGDRFALAFEKFTRDDGPSTYGAIGAAEFENGGRVLRAFRFTPPGGKPAYYDEQGRSLRRFFLKSPLKFEPRITSGFSMRRFHPVLGRYRAHLGVDYGAPTGAPVVAVAAGTVVSATFDRANGRMVRLRHGGGYETYYLHLSAFGAGIRAGAHVAQGQVIGKVGATGLASGPHLDYRVRRNGTFVNPLVEHRNMPPGEPIPASALAAFRAERDRALMVLGQAMKSTASAGVATVSR